MFGPLSIDQFRCIAAVILGVGAEGARAAVDVAKAESALNAGFAGFGGYSLFPNPIHRAAVTASRLNRNHSLPDGNKRASVVVLSVMLEELGLQIEASDDEFVWAIEGLASGSVAEDQFIGWVEQHVVAIPASSEPHTRET